MVLHNPDMGWVLYENFPVDPKSSKMNADPSAFDGVDYVAVMFTWADVENEQGVYDFSQVDRAYDYWKALGKRLLLRISTESLLWWEPVSGIGVPHYVREQLAAGEKQLRVCAWEEGRAYWVFDARNPYYQERLRRFLASVARHYADRSRPVELVDMRGFGLWGEWHTGFQYESLEAKREALKAIIDIWYSAFPRQGLVLSYSFDPDSPSEYYLDPTHYRDYLEYSAFDYALSKPGMGWRRDGCGEVVRPVERMLCEEAFRTLKSGPFMSEPAQPVRLETADHVLADELSLHPNYITALPEKVAAARPELFKKGLLQMGYRFVLETVQYPEEASAGEKIQLVGGWRNRAEGRALRDYGLKVFLQHAGTGARQEVAFGPTGCQTWVKGECYVTSRTIDLPEGQEPGVYTLSLGLYDEHTKQYIGLAVTNANPDKTVNVGRISIKG